MRTLPTASQTVNRKRRTKAQIAELDNRIVAILRDDHPQSVRHVFYRLVDDRTVEVPKTDAGYKQVGYRLHKLRWSRRVAWNWISDSTRRGHFVTTYHSPRDFMDRTLGMYRLNEWAAAEYRVEVWCESRSLAGTLYGTCQALGVDLYPAGGFCSDTFVWEAAEEIRHIGKQTVLLYAGDYDPAGVMIDQDILRKLHAHLPDHPIELRRLAVTEDQIRRWRLPTRPRKAGDRRRLDIRETVEAEAIPASRLRQLLRDAVDEYLPAGVRERTRLAEEAQRETLRCLSAQVDKLA